MDTKTEAGTALRQFDYVTGHQRIAALWRCRQAGCFQARLSRGPQAFS